MQTLAVVVEAPGRVALRRLAMTPPDGDDVVVTVEFSGISMGTEKLLFNGLMPQFPGMGYPLVPGYEAVGRVVDAGSQARGRIGEQVFVPGSTKFIGARGLFGGSAQTLVSASSRVLGIPEGMGETAVLLSLAATAQHALAGGGAAGPDCRPWRAGAIAGADGGGGGALPDGVGDQPRPHERCQGLCGDGARE